MPARLVTLVLTVIGDDRPGVVSALSGPASSHEAGWERSQMARLAGKFAGIVELSVPEDRVEALTAELEALRGQGLQVVVARTDAPTEQPVVLLQLDLLGADHPGIVAEVSAALAARGVGIEELSTGLREAPMAGGLLFEARAVLSAAPDADVEDLRATLERLADELMVDITLSDG